MNSQVNNTKNDSTDFRLLTTNLLPTTFCNKITPNSTLYVTDFVNESNLDNQSELGFLLSNELKVNLLKNNCSKNVMIKTFDLAQNLKMGRNGAKILTRELSKLKTQSIEDDKQIVIGSYSLTNKKIILFVKLVNLKDGNTIASNSSSDELTDEIKELEGIKDLDNSQSIKKPFHL
ncbi:MAG: hypothetical protein HY307_04950 [Arcobacter sp.]|nr:hypothetical protein [Arcobacter sp.]